MRFGVSISSTHPDDGPRLMIERARQAHEAGFASLSIGDHHNMKVPYAQNTPMLGRLLAEWPDRPAGCLFLVPLWHPVLMAEQIGTLAATHDDRFIIQTGIGHGAAQFAAFDAAMGTRGRVLEESITVVKAMLAGEVVDSAMLNVRGGRVGLRPRGEVEWWIGGSAEVAIRRAAVMGDCWYAGPGLDEASARRSLAIYREAGGTMATVRRDALVLDDGDEARRVATELVERGYRGLLMSDLLVGTVDDVADQAAPFAQLGFDQMIIRCLSVEQALALETLSHLGPLEL